jgi:damage-control phosphatase, subfamily I
MLTQSQCLPCFMDDISQAAELLIEDASRRSEVLRLCLRQLSLTFDFLQPPSYHITALHRCLKQALGLDIPFCERRKWLNEMGMEVAREIRHEAKQLEDYPRFRHLAVWALAANSLDSRTAGTGYAFDPRKVKDYLSSYLEKGLALDELRLLFQRIPKAERILYLHDNVGELALDAALIEEIRKSSSGPVISALRGGAITSDATYEDGLTVGLQTISDQMIIAGPDTLGISLVEMSPELSAELRRADLVLAKGQANFYVLSEYSDQVKGDIFCLFSTKCDPVATQFGLRGRQLLAVFLPRKGSGNVRN